MNVEYLIQVLENRLNMLLQAKDQAFITGDIERINSVDNEISGVQDTLSKLKLLTDISTAANLTNTSETVVVAAGVEAVQSSDAVAGSVIVLNEYDLSTYATDPDYEKKINSILDQIGELSVVDDIETHIQSVVSGAPVTGQMVMNSATKYAISVRLLTAMLELESRFGTAGVGASTNNPGNVGNTGTDTQTFGSWQEGVEAVAEWLSRHRVSSSTQVNQNNNQQDQQPTEQTAQTTQPAIPGAILTGLAVIPASTTLFVGDTQQLIAKSTDQSGVDFNGATITFASDNMNVATVDGAGLVTAISEGDAVITCNATAGKVTLIKLGSVRVNIKEEATPPPAIILTSATLLPATTDLVSGSIQQLTVKAFDQNGKDFNGAVFNFSSDSPSVATVDSSGSVIAISAGAAVITVFANADGIVVTASAFINVSEPAPVVENPEPIVENPEPNLEGSGDTSVVQ